VHCLILLNGDECHLLELGEADGFNQLKLVLCQFAYVYRHNKDPVVKKISEAELS